MNKMQKVLDLDLDIFVNPLVEFCKESEDRADSGQFSLAPFEFIMDSLDRRLKLSDDEEAPGDCLVYHSEVYYRWRSLVQSGRLKVPFEVVHVDGHADLGMGDASYVYLFEEWIYEANKMKNPKTPGIDSITAEVLKAGGKPMTEMLHKIFNAIWMQEKTPKD